MLVTLSFSLSSTTLSDYLQVVVTGIPHLPLNVDSYVAVIDTVQLGTSLSKSYFYIWYKDERSESIPWDANATLVKLAIEQMTSLVGCAR